MLTVDTSALTRLANSFPKEFENIALDAAELAGIKGVQILQDKITENEQVRTGNLRNSVTHTQPKSINKKIVFELIVGSPIQLSTIDEKTGKAIVDPAQPRTYAEYQEEINPYGAPSLPKIRREIQKLMQQAVGIYVRRENA